MRIAVVADTHIRRTGSRRLSSSVYRRLERADAVLHAGDVVVGEVLEDLARFAPVHAVRGNNDHELDALPETLELELGGARIAMIHDSGAARGRERRLFERFPRAALVVFGHSHIPLIAAGVGAQRLLNPGSPTDKRRMPSFTMAMLEAADGRILRPRIVTVERD